MKALRGLWLVGSVTLAVVGIGMALVVSPAELASLFVVFAAIGATATPCVLSDFGERPPRARVRLVLRCSLISGTAGGAVAGLVLLSGASGLFLVVLVLLSSPYAVRTYRRWMQATPNFSAAQLDTVLSSLAYASPDVTPYQLLSELRGLSDERLCQAWRASYKSLQEPSSAKEKIVVVEERQEYLDEFERRNPKGFVAWLASGARAPGNPLPYLMGTRYDSPSINWDELTRGQDR